MIPTFFFQSWEYAYWCRSYSTVFWGSDCCITYYQAISFLTIELSLAIKSSPLYPHLEMKLLVLSFISIFILKI